MKYVITVILLILINTILPYIVEPYIQANVNRHTATFSDILVLSYFLSGFAILIFSIFKSFGLAFRIVLIGIAANVIFWSYKLSIIECIHCIRS